MKKTSNILLDSIGFVQIDEGTVAMDKASMEEQNVMEYINENKGDNIVLYYKEKKRRRKKRRRRRR